MISRRYPPKMRTVTDKRRTLSALMTRGWNGKRAAVGKRRSAKRVSGGRRSRRLCSRLFFDKQKQAGLSDQLALVLRLFFRGVCLAAAARSAAALVYAKHTPWCQAAMIQFKIRYKKSPDMLCHRGLNLFYSDSSLRRLLSCMQRKRGSCFVCARSMPSTRRDAREGIRIPCRLLPFCGRGLLF